MIEAWKIGVSIAMTSNASQVLGTLGRDLFGLGKQAEALQSKLGLVKAAAIGAMGVVAGGAAITGMVKLVEHGKELVHQQALMHAAGMDNQAVAEATAKAWANTRDVMGTGVSENMKNIRELRMVFGSTQEAMDNLQVVTKAQMVMNSVRGQGAGDQVFDMAKALEIKGVSQDPAHFNALVDAMVKATIASGGKVIGSDFFNAFKYGRTATQGWDDNFVGQILPTLIQEMKGGGGGGVGGPGNALQSAFQAVVGGVMSNKAAGEFVRLGLVDPTKVIRTSTGSVKGIEPGGVRGSATFQQDPYAWVQNNLVPALKAHGITSADGIREEVAHMFVNRTAQQIMTMFTTQQARFEKDANLIRGAQGVDAQKNLLATDPTAKMAAFTAAWQNLLTALGAPLVEPAYHLLDKLTAGISWLAKVVSEHPDAARITGEIAAGLSALSVALGAFAIGSAAIGALTGAAVGMTALGAALLPFAVGAAGAVALDSLITKLEKMVGGFAPASGGPQQGAKGVSPDWHETTKNRPGGPIIGDDDYRVQKESYVPTGAGNAPMVHTITYVQLDGRTIAKAVSDQQARGMSMPPAGTSRFDGRMTPSSPGQLVSA